MSNNLPVEAMRAGAMPNGWDDPDSTPQPWRTHDDDGRPRTGRLGPDLLITGADRTRRCSCGEQVLLGWPADREHEESCGKPVPARRAKPGPAAGQ
jgi:hypothetical protein